MVLLTMTPAVAEVVHLYLDHADHQNRDGEPALEAAAPGSPISHGQLIGIASYLKNNLQKLSLSRSDGTALPHHLSDLLKGCSIYTPPPTKPKAEQTPEYKELMARLRREEESRTYERMVNPPLFAESFGQRFPNAQYANLFPSSPSKDDDDETTYADVDRQVALIFNVAVSIVACGAAIFIAARHWNAPARLAVSMAGAIVVGVAEVVIYMGYLRRIREAKVTEKKKVERKEVTETWVIESKPNSKTKEKIGSSGMRLRGSQSTKQSH